MTNAINKNIRPERDIGRSFESGKRAARNMLGDSVTALQQVSWGVAFALHARGLRCTAAEVALRWHDLFSSIELDAPASFVFMAMMQWVNKRIKAIHWPSEIAQNVFDGLSDDEITGVANLSLDFLYDESIHLVRQAEDVTALIGARQLVPRAVEVARRTATRHGLSNIGWMQGTNTWRSSENTAYLPFSPSLIKKPTLLQCGFCASSARSRWFLAQCHGKTVWTNDKVIDWSRPNFRGWKETLIPCPGSSDAAIRPDVTAYFEQAQKARQKPMVPFVIGKNTGPDKADVVVFDGDGVAILLDMVWVGYLLHKYKDGRWLFSSTQAPVAFCVNEEIVALVAPVVLTRHKDGSVPYIAELKRAICINN